MVACVCGGRPVDWLDKMAVLRNPFVLTIMLLRLQAHISTRVAGVPCSCASHIGIANIAAALGAGEVNLGGFGMGSGAGGIEGIALGDDGEDTATGGDPAFGGEFGAAMENACLAVIQPGDEVAAVGGGGVAGAGQDAADAPAFVEGDEFRGEFALGALETEGGQVALQQGHDGFAFGVAEAAVVFDDLGALRGEHEAEVEEATVGQTIGLESAHGGRDDGLFDGLEEFW